MIAPVDEAEFERLFTRRVTELNAGVTFQRTGPFAFRILLPDGASVGNVFLDNQYRAYLSDPSTLTETIDRLARLVVDLKETHGVALDVGLIVPVIKGAEYLDELRRGLDPKDAESVSKIYYEKLNARLIVLYAEDSKESMRFLMSADVARLDLHGATLRQTAVQNLKKLLPEMTLTGSPDTLLLVNAGGAYEASILLLDSMWTREKLDMPGEFVVAVPSRDMLLVTGSNNADGVRGVRKLARDFAAGSAYSISPDLFVRRGDSWEVLPR